MATIYKWACEKLDGGEIAIITVRGDGPWIIDGYTFEVEERAHTEGIEIEELVRVTARCHRYAAEADCER